MVKPTKYNRMNVVEDTLEEDLDPDIELEQEDNSKDSGIGEDSSITDDDDNDDNNEKSNTKNSETKITADESQLAKMLTVVWAIFIFGIVLTAVGLIGKHKNKTEETKVVLKDKMYTLSSIATEEDVWQDVIVVEKKVQSNGNTIAFYFAGNAMSYGTYVYIPVTHEEFNSVNNGDTITFEYSRLSIEGVENILIRRWNKR